MENIFELQEYYLEPPFKKYKINNNPVQKQVLYLWDNKLIKYFANKAGGPVIELASGTGRLAKIILELGLAYTGLDTSKEYIKISKKRYGARGTFYVQNMQNFHLETQLFYFSR